MRITTIFEEFNSKYAPDDIVYIRYWFTGDTTPVKIVSSNGNRYIVSFNVEGSLIPNAPDMEIKASNIIGVKQTTSDIEPTLNIDITKAKRITNDLALNTYPDGKG